MMESIVLYVVLVIISFCFGYWRGFASGISKLVTIEMNQFPLNVAVRTENSIMYAYHMMTEDFLGQSADMGGLIEIIRKKYPEQTIIFSHESSEVNK